MPQKLRVKNDPSLYIKRCNDGYDTCGEEDATIFEDFEIDQVIEDLFYGVEEEICEPETEE